MDSDPDLRVELETAEAWGIAHKRLLGWEPRTTTRYKYRRGRLVKAVTTRDVEWDEEQRGLALALHAWRATRCPHCGGDLDETTNPVNEGRYRVETNRCHRCTALDVAARKFIDGKVAAPHALLHRARLPKPTALPGG